MFSRSFCTALVTLSFSLALWAQAPVVAPYIENFDTDNPCPSSTTGPCPLVGLFIQDSGDGGDWIVNAGTTGSVNTGPPADHTTGTPLGNYLYTETSGALVGSERRLLSPILDLTSAANPLVTYWYHLLGAQMGTLHTDLVQGVNAGTDGLLVPGVGTGTLTSAVSFFSAGSAGDTVTISGTSANDGVYTIVTIVDDFTITVTPDFVSPDFAATYRHERLILDPVPPINDNQDLWQQQFVPLLSALQTPGNILEAQVRLRGVAGAGLTSDMAIDDFAFVDGTGTDVGTVSIDSPGSNTICAGTYSVLATIENFGTSPQSNIPVTVSQNGTILVTDVIPGPLNGGTTLQHTFTVTATVVAGASTLTVSTGLPGDADASNDSVTRPLTATPAVTTFPYFEDFESGSGGWSVGGSTSLNFGFPITPLMGGAASGNFCFVTNQTGNYANNENGFVRSPCFDLSGLTDPYVSLSVFWECYANADGMNLQYSIDGGGTWTTLGATGDQLNWYNSSTVSAAPGGSQSGWSGRQTTNDGSGGWIHAVRELTPLIGQSSVEFRLNFASNGTLIAEGVGFDDFRVFDAISLFPGSGEDLVLETGVAGGTITNFPGTETKMATLGDQVSIRTSSPATNYLGAPYALVANPFATGGALPIPISPTFPEVHVGSTAVIVVDGNDPSQSAGLPFVIGPNGSTLDFVVLDPVLIGASVLLQSLVLDPAAANGFFAITDGLVIEVQ